MKNKINLGFALGCVVILLVGIVSNLSTYHLINRFKWIEHTIQVRNEIARLKSSYMTAQTNLRGFHLTGQEYYLVIYREAKAEIPIALDEIKKLTKDNPDQKAELEGLAGLLDKRILRWEWFAKERAENGLESVQSAMMGEQAKISIRRS
jgi:CHASE3 domain sensor protein